MSIDNLDFLRDLSVKRMKHWGQVTLFQNETK